MVSLPLPTPAVQPSELTPNAGGVLGALYTADQLQAYGQACREQALDEAAHLCDYENTAMHDKMAEAIRILI